jgi:hypothetical protein
MRNLLALVGLLVVVGGGAGWYMGWYKFSFARTADGTIQIKTDVDPKKVEADSSTFFKNAATVVGNRIDKAAPAAATPDAAPGATPGPVTPAQGSVVVPPALPGPDALPQLPVPPAAPNVPIPVPDVPGAPGRINLLPPK